MADYLFRVEFMVIDELGYLPFAQSGAQLLFHLISRFYKQTSIIVTTIATATAIGWTLEADPQIATYRAVTLVTGAGQWKPRRRATMRYPLNEEQPNGSLMSILPFMLAPASVPTGEVLLSASARGLFFLVIAVAAVAGIHATDPSTAHAAGAEAGADLTRLLRLMTLIKAAMAAAAVGAALWRLGWPVSPGRFGIYALTCATMVAGPGLIWGMAHVGLGALLLHAGLAATIGLLWRDPAVWRGLDAALQRRIAR